jgi:hypothetical protein
MTERAAAQRSGVCLFGRGHSALGVQPTPLFFCLSLCLPFVGLSLVSTTVTAPGRRRQRRRQRQRRQRPRFFLHRPQSSTTIHFMSLVIAHPPSQRRLSSSSPPPLPSSPLSSSPPPPTQDDSAMAGPTGPTGPTPSRSSCAAMVRYTPRRRNALIPLPLLPPVPPHVVVKRIAGVVRLLLSLPPLE